MIVSIIAAVDRNLGIGKDNKLPWHLSEDLKRFKKLTMGHHLIMGRKTFESIGRPLPGRVSIVLSRRLELIFEGVLMARSLEDALRIASDAGESEAFVLGGGEIFEQALPVTERIYLTRVESSTDADTFFPQLISEDWEEKLVSSYPADEKNEYSHTFFILEKINTQSKGSTKSL
ncbi:MAG: dihydrofolate reductase [Chloroflexi bacterium]|nr:MAG: dihydrofolate reductase [Chloroflexota bacterium]